MAEKTSGAVQGKRYFCVEMLPKAAAAHRPGRDVLRLPGAFIEARQAAVGIADVKDVLVLGIDGDVAALAAAHGIPIAGVDLAVIGAAGNGGGAAILLGAVDVVRELVVGDRRGTSARWVGCTRCSRFGRHRR